MPLARCPPPALCKLANTAASALFVKNLNYNVSPDDLFELFGKFGPVRCVPRHLCSFSY